MAGITTGLIVGGLAAGASAYGASQQAKAAKRAANAEVEASRDATQLQRDTTNYAIAQSAPVSRAQMEAYARQMLMQGIPADQVKAYLRDAYAASYQTLPNGDAPATGGSGIGFRGGGGGTATPAPAPAPNPYDSSWVDGWSYQSSSPSYNFRLGEGQKALERSKAASGDFFSGDTAIALNQYGQNFASQEFENDFRRLGSLYGGGSGASDSGNVAVNFGQQAGANTIAAGNARASGYQNQGNIWGNFWGNTVPGAVGYGYGQGWWGK